MCSDKTAPTCRDSLPKKCQDGSAAKDVVKKITTDKATGEVRIVKEKDGATVTEVIGAKKCANGGIPTCSDGLPES